MSRLFGKVFLAAIMLLAVSVQPAQSGDFWEMFRCHVWPRCVGPTTCDDFCGKPEPCPAPVCGFTCDDYCRKCLPQPHVANCFTCDDYCPKPAPAVCCPWSNFLTPHRHGGSCSQGCVRGCTD